LSKKGKNLVAGAIFFADTVYKTLVEITAPAMAVANTMVVFPGF
jgi:hypothetical protein